MKLIKLPAEERIIFPLDVSSSEEATLWVERLNPFIGVFKIGLELFISEGPQIIEKIRNKTNKKIFLDLKLNDIPNTVSKAVRVISNMGVDWVSVHLLAGSLALRKALELAYNNLKIIGITILTSLDRADLLELGFNAELAKDLKELVLRLAFLAYQTGCEGIVCSAKEVEKVKENFPELITIVPGIRLSEERRDDQLRTATPYEAILLGADYLVIGRPIKEASFPEKVCEEIIVQIKRALEEREDD
ncbi:MAG: orotidine-5'-phosphate decarboxylase [Thermodesulfobacteriaceae bacterium]|nr:orotidine-5'-phosphate decarboxylase [Thermodesulfobacteriaceae bacterium]MCX8041206.1 orotidine-5'-phosphate decarboxylase [Thermodesulfobacteriaceae bacterium]MDW8136348.1 orotidine-5'-phosphate decarboxylase [Thermodesulfobacterium sp.]